MDDGRRRRTSTASSAASRGRRERLRRAPSAASATSAGRASSASASRSSEFSAFLSDSSSDEDEEDADARAIARMQQQADDMDYLPERADAPLFRIDSPNTAGLLPDQVEEEEEEEDGAGDSFVAEQEQGFSLAGSDLRPSVDDARASQDDGVRASDARSEGSDARSEGSGSDEDGDYIEENDDSFVAVNRPVFDDEDSDEEQDEQQRRGIRDTSAFEVAEISAGVSSDEEEEQVVAAVDEGEDACVTVSIDDTPLVPSFVNEAPQSHLRESAGIVQTPFVVQEDSSFSGVASPARDPFLRVNDSFIGDRRGSADSADKSFMDDKPRATLGSVGGGSFGDPFLRVNDSFIGGQRGSTASVDRSFQDDALRPTFGSAGAGSFGDPFLSVNDSFIGIRRASADSADKSFLEVKPRPTHGSMGAGSFSEDIDASFRLDHYGDSFGSTHNDSYAADHAPFADTTPSEHLPDDTAPSAGNESSISDPVNDDREVFRQHQDSTETNFMSANVRRIQDSQKEVVSTESASVASPAPSGHSGSEVVADRVSSDEVAGTGGRVASLSPVEKVSPPSIDMEQIRFSRVPTSTSRDSGRPIDFRDTQHQFDEEEVHMHHTEPLSPLYQHGENDEDGEVPGFRENAFSNSLNSSTSSFANKDGNFFVGSDRGSDTSSYSNSISDSFASVVIMGDTALDANSFVGARRSDVSADDTTSEKLDRSYSSLIDQRRVQPTQGQQASLTPVNLSGVSRPSTPRSVLSLSSASVSSVATDEELSFVSFNASRPPTAARSSERSSSKSGESGSSNQSQSSTPSFFMRDSNATVRHADSLANAQRSIKRVSDVHNPVRSSSGSFVDASFASSFNDSETFPDMRVRGDTRSDEIEAGDVAQGALPSLPPPLKIGIATASPATSNPSLLSSSSFGSFAGSDVVRNTDDHLDFTGVYRGSVNSLESSRVAVAQSAPNPSPPRQDAPSVPPPIKPTPADEEPEASEPPAAFSASVVQLARSVSDNVQRESQRKVEDFFRRTYQYQKGDDDIDDIDDDIRWTTRNRATRARTTVIYCVDENEEMREHANRNRSSTIATTKIIDLKNLKGGPKLYQKVLTPQRESEDFGPYIAESTPQGAPSRRTSRFYANDLTGDVIEPSTMETPADMSYYANLGKDAHGRKPLEAAGVTSSAAKAASPADNVSAYAPVVQYGLSPKANDAQEKSSGFFSASRSTAKRVGSLGAFGGNRRADNVSLTSLTPSQPRISMDSSSFAPSPYTVAMLTKSPGMAKWQQDHRDLGVSPGSSVSVKESMFRPTGLSRPTFSEQVASHVHQFSASLTNTIRRAGAALLGQSSVKHGGENDLTSPQSTCPAPPRLAQSFDEREFYSRFARRGGVEEPHDLPVKPAAPLSTRQRKRRNARVLRMAAAAIVGIVLGIILTQVSGLDDAFGVDASQARVEQAYNGELILPVATQWMLLPGRLFLRVWNCVAIPLLFCHVANGVADMVMGEKESLLLGFRTFGVMLLISLIATLEGIAAMAITNNAGWFQTSDAVKLSAMAAAQSLEQSLGTSVYAVGAVGLLCSSNHEYLQQLGSDQFNCSNASIALPVYNSASGNGTIQGSGAAIFALLEVTNGLSTSKSNATAAAARYYPKGLTVDGALEGLFVTGVPSNSALSFVQSSPLSVVAVALIVGLFCGKRAFRRLLALKAAFDSSTRSYNTRAALAAEQNARQPHYLLGILVELQLALEWILVQVETYIAPLGMLSLLGGNMVAHFQEWQTIVTPMVQLITGVFVLCLVHVVVVMPVFMKICFKTNVFTKVLGPFVPSFLFVFCSGTVALTSPVTARCFADARIVTKSASQVMSSLTGVLHRSGNALYFPLALLWLMETNTLSANASALNFDGSSYLLISVLILCSCFAALSPTPIVTSGVTSRGNLAILMTLWRVIVSHSSSDPSVATAVPMTFPLLVIVDVLLSRVVDIVNVFGGLMATLIVADHCDEAVVNESEVGPVSNSVLSPVYL
jgi:Na+/H+-dicarboxylate symporter